MSDPRNPGDAAAIGGGALVLYANHAELLVPIFTAVFLLLSILWLLWRMYDRWREGPDTKDSDNGD